MTALFLGGLFLKKKKMIRMSPGNPVEANRSDDDL